jgi:hypothetical protein
MYVYADELTVWHAGYVCIIGMKLAFTYYYYLHKLTYGYEQLTYK